MRIAASPLLRSSSPERSRWVEVPLAGAPGLPAELLEVFHPLVEALLVGFHRLGRPRQLDLINVHGTVVVDGQHAVVRLLCNLGLWVEGLKSDLVSALEIDIYGWAIADLDLLDFGNILDLFSFRWNEGILP